MRQRNKAVLLVVLSAAVLAPAQTTSSQSAPAQAPLTVDRDPVRSPDAEPPNAAAGTIRKEGAGFVLHTDVEEVVLNATVLEGNRLVPDLKAENFHIFEEGTKQTIISFQH